MKLTEILVAIVVFIIASTVFTASFINVRKSIVKTEEYSKKAIEILEKDFLIRKEIRKIEVPYWKSFEKEFQKEKKVFEEQLKILASKNEMEIVSVSSVYDKKKKAEGIKVEWMTCNKKYESQEFICQRIVDEE